jgi:hypothetical protein
MAYRLFLGAKTGGPKNLSRTASDAVSTASDSLVRSVEAKTRTGSDSISSISDAVAGALIKIRDAADSLLSVAESISRAAMSFVRPASDSVSTLTEAASRLMSAARSSADSLGGGGGTVVVYGNTSDAEIQSGGGSIDYATARAGYALSAGSYFVLRIGQADNGDGEYTENYVWQGFVAFDTSSVASGDTVSAAVLSVTGVNDWSDTDFDLQARDKDWGATVDTSDWVTSYGTLRAHRNTSAGVTGDLTDDAMAAGVVKAGTTRLLLVSSRTVAGAGPTNPGLEYVEIYSADQAGTTQDPKLTVTVAGSGITESLARAAQSMSRSLFDSAGSLTESVVRGAMSVARSLSDSVSSITDAAERMTIKIRTLTDALGSLADDAQRVTLAARTLVDSASPISELVGRATTMARSSADELAGPVGDLSIVAHGTPADIDQSLYVAARTFDDPPFAVAAKVVYDQYDDAGYGAGHAVLVIGHAFVSVYTYLAIADLGDATFLTEWQLRFEVWGDPSSVTLRGRAWRAGDGVPGWTTATTSGVPRGDGTSAGTYTTIDSASRIGGITEALARALILARSAAESLPTLSEVASRVASFIRRERRPNDP